MSLNVLKTYVLPIYLLSITSNHFDKITILIFDLYNMTEHYHLRHFISLLRTIPFAYLSFTCTCHELLIHFLYIDAIYI